MVMLQGEKFRQFFELEDEPFEGAIFRKPIEVIAVSTWRGSSPCRNMHMLQLATIVLVCSVGEGESAQGVPIWSSD